MPHRHLRHLAAVCAAIALTTALAACGDDSSDDSGVPEGAIAVVGKTEITQADFDHWMTNKAPQQGLEQAPDPPEYEKCIASLQKQLREERRKNPVPQGYPVPTRADFKKQCATRLKALTEIVTRFLIEAATYRQAGKELGLVVTAAEAREAQFLTKKEYRTALKATPLSKKDFLYQLHVFALQSKVLTKLRADAEGDADADDARDYYKKHKKEFTPPTSRSVLSITSKSRAKAEQAKRRLQAGESWQAAAKAVGGYATPEPTQFVEAQAQPGTVGEPVFKARKGTVEGPIKTDAGWSVFKVTKITGGRTPPFEKLKDAVIDRLNATPATEAVVDFQERNRKKTVCKEGHVLRECSNAPPEEVPGAPEPPSGE
jgi:parvulin-like peptidyl-prolyl isomerase